MDRGFPARHGDPCPQCEETKHLRWGINPDGVYVYCRLCLFDSRGAPYTGPDTTKEA